MLREISRPAAEAADLRKLSTAGLAMMRSAADGPSDGSGGISNLSASLGVLASRAVSFS